MRQHYPRGRKKWQERTEECGVTRVLEEKKPRQEKLEHQRYGGLRFAGPTGPRKNFTFSPERQPSVGLEGFNGEKDLGGLAGSGGSNCTKTEQFRQWMFVRKKLQRRKVRLSRECEEQ